MGHAQDGRPPRALPAGVCARPQALSAVGRQRPGRGRRDARGRAGGRAGGRCREGGCADADRGACKTAATLPVRSLRPTPSHPP
eukprot:364760-Chlamydomonas_euryale.AAC.1